jgi:hypothetical protein
MRKYSVFISYAFSTIFILQIVACNTNSNDTTTVEDSTQPGAVTDSMPVVNTPITDSSAIITTPRINDDNVVNPDTSKK